MAIYEFRMPELGEGLHEGEIVKWHVKPGDSIEEDQLLMDVQNDKATVEVPSPVSGRVVELKVNEGAVAVVGDVLAVLEVEGEAAESLGPASDGQKPEKKTEQPSPAGQPAADVPKAQPANEHSAAGKLILATPGVRRLAREKGVLLTEIKGTGKNGRITREDVLAHAEGKAPAANEAAKASAPQAETAGNEMADHRPEERQPLKGVRKAIANAMVKSAYTAPHVTIMDEVDVSKLVALRTKAKPLAEQKGVKLTYLPFIVKALVAAARQYPDLNASIDEDKNEIVYKKYYHVGIATDTENGLIVPVIEDADRKNIWTIAAQIKDLAERGREGKLKPQEMKGSTITITNIGSAGGMFFTPIINYPEVAILGTGRITEKPVVRNGEIVIGHVMALSLSFDHRLIDGATAQRALNYIKQLLEDPDLLVMEV